MDNLMCTPSNQANVPQQQQETSPITNTNKKLYFKQSATEALHSAILLKARNPAASSQLKPTNDTSNNNSNKILLLNPKQTSQTNLISISSMSNLASQQVSSSPSLNDDSSFQSADLLLLQANNTTNSTTTNNNNNYSDELDSPLKIKENILTSIRNLKPVLAGLSSSTSDDDDDVVNIISDSSQIEQNQSEVILIGSTLPNVNPTNLLNNNNNINNSNGVVKLTISSNAPPPLNASSMQRHGYLRTNTCYAKLNTTTTNTPKLPSALNETKLTSLTTTTTTTSNQSTTVTPPIIFNKSAASCSLASSSLLLAKPQFNKLTVRSKRGQEEALSNSSSSDEEADLQQNVLQQRNGNQKLQLILNNTNTLKSLITTTTTNKQNLLTVNSQSTWSNTKLIEQPQITPVVSASAAAAAAVVAASLSSTNIITQSVSSSYANSDSDLINSPSSMSSNKSDSDYGSMTGTNLSFSISSPTSCCSSSNSSSCTTNDSSSAIDLNDDTSSTASGPIYVRQPGFEFHAHEVHLPQQAALVTQPNEQQKKNLTRATKKTTDSSKQTSNTKANTKAKKKLCMMLNTELSPIATRDSDSSLKQCITNTNIHLKPISTKAKREPLPMRLRALPTSFWQQPNQPNPSLSTMYLPPLFKNEIIDSSVLDDTDASLASIDDANTLKMFDSPAQNQNREVRISPANTDLLFKLFDNIEQKQDTKKQLALQMQLKSSRLNLKGVSPVKAGLSKALIKGEDPCIVDAVTEGLFPLLRLDSRTDTTTVQYHLPFGANTKSDLMLSSLNSNGLSSSSPVLCSSTSAAGTVNSNLISMNNANLLPSIQFEQNYSQALSEVVAAL